MKTKTIFLSLFLMLASLGLWAQEKYDFLVVRNGYEKKGQGYEKAVFIISKDKMETIIVDKADSPWVIELQKVNELQDRGWEVFNTTTVAIESTEQTVYFLRKKKN